MSSPEIRKLLTSMEPEEVVELLQGCFGEEELGKISGGIRSNLLTTRVQELAKRVADEKEQEFLSAILEPLEGSSIPERRIR